MVLDYSVLGIKEVATTANNLTSMHFKPDVIKKGIENSDMPPNEMEMLANTLHQVAKEKSGENMFKIKQCDVQRGWQNYAKRKCQEASKSCGDISYEDFCNYNSFVNVDEYIKAREEGKDYFAKYITMKQMSGRAVDINAFLAEGLNPEDYEKMNAINDILDREEQQLIESTIIPNVEYNEIAVENLPTVNVVYNNNRNSHFHKFTPEERSVIYTWATNVNIKDERNKWDLISEGAFKYPENERRKRRKITWRSVKEQWMNFIEVKNPEKEWRKEEGDILVEKYKKWGPRWEYLSTFFPGKTPNDLKRKYYSLILKIVGVKRQEKICQKT